MQIYDDIFGKVLENRYRVLQLVGAGKFGKVFKARQEIFGIPFRNVALKMFTDNLVNQANAKEVFKEAILLEGLISEARLRGEDPCLVTVYDVGIMKDYSCIPFIAMEYVTGGTLSDEIRRNRGFTVETIIRNARKICVGLKLAHQSQPAIIHRDLKPDNIFLSQRGVLKIGDFGLAIDRYSACQVEGVVGTITYLSPEAGRGEVSSPASDIYSLGVIMIEMLLNRNPLQQVLERANNSGQSGESAIAEAQRMIANLQDPETGRALFELKPELKSNEYSGFQEMLKRCLSLNPSQRIANAAILDEVLESLQADNPISLPSADTVSQKDVIQMYLQEGHSHLNLKQLSVAEAKFRNALKINSNEARAYVGISLVKEKEGNVKEAIASQDSAVKLHPTYETMMRLSNLYGKNGQQLLRKTWESRAKTMVKRRLLS